TAHRFGSAGRPSAAARLGQESPILSMAFWSCRLASRAVPRARSCSWGCCRMSTAVRFRTGVISAHTQSARGLRQRGQSALAADDDGSGMGRLYASVGQASIVPAAPGLLAGGGHEENPAMELRERTPPNHDARPAGGRIDMLVLHYTGMKTAAEATDRLCDPLSKVSAHYVIDEDGTVWRLVEESRRAWHAGLSFWQGTEN